MPFDSDLLLAAFLAAAVAAVVTSSLVSIVTRLALAMQAMDQPGGRREQETAIPRLGGVAVVFGLGTSLLFAAALLRNTGQLPFPRTELLALALATFMVFLVGLVDDISGVSVLDKFLVQLLAAFLVVRMGWSFDVLGLPGGHTLDLGAFGPATSVLWIVGVTNAINLIDGLDGLAGGVVAIIAGSFLVYSLLQGDALTIVAMAAVMGGCLGFLRYNWAPARIYLGDSGSLTLGFVLATTSLQSSLKAPAAVAILVPILALGLPVIDTLLVMAVRFAQRPNGPISSRLLGMFEADRNHIHHMLLRLAKSRRNTVVWIYGAVLVFCALALTVAVTRSSAVGALLLATEFAAVIAMRQLGFRAEARALAAQQRLDVREDLTETSAQRLDMHAAALGELAREAPLQVTIAGGCMAPGIASGTILEVAPARAYWPGDVVVFRRGDGRLVAHRVIGLRPGKWLFTQADASAVPDSVVKLCDVIGRALVPVSAADRSRALVSFVRLAASRLRARFA